MTDLGFGVGPQCTCNLKQAHLIVWVDSLSKLRDEQSQSYVSYVTGSDAVRLYVCIACGNNTEAYEPLKHGLG